MRRVPWWGVVSSLAAPVLLIGGWTLALAWFFAEQRVSGPSVGLAERVAAGAQATWPLAVVLSVRYAHGLDQPTNSRSHGL